jgi:HEAT repeat protein
VPRWLTQHRLHSKSVETRRKATQQLCEKPDPKAIPSLKEALEDEDAEVRRLAVTALGKLDKSERIEPLLLSLRDPDVEVRKAAVQSLKQVPGDVTVGALLPLLRDADADVRGHAAQVLELQGWHPADRADEMWLCAAKGQLARMVSFGPEAIAVLHNVVQSSPYGLCVAALKALGEIGGVGIIAAVVPALKSAEAAVCVAAVEALGKAGGPQAVEPVIGMLRHPNAQVRTAAVEALGTLRASGVADVVAPLLQDTVWDVRRAAAESLGKLQDPRAVDVLVGTLHDGDPDVRETSARSLGRLGDPRAIGPLVMSLKDSTSTVRRVAVGALTQIDKDWTSSAEARIAFEQLKATLQADDAEVRHFVGHILESVGALPAMPAMTAAPAMPAAFVAEYVGPTTAESQHKFAASLVLAILYDSDRDLRQAAAKALGFLGDARAEAGLTHALSDADPAVRLEIEESLRILADSRAPEIPPPPGQVRIEETLLCSGTGEVLYESGCDSEKRGLLLAQVEQQSIQIGNLAQAGAFDRLEILTREGRLICHVQPDRRIFVRSFAPQWQSV